MPYHEGKEQAHIYFEVGKNFLAQGNTGQARSNFNLAKIIAENNGMRDLAILIQGYLDDL